MRSPLLRSGLVCAATLGLASGALAQTPTPADPAPGEAPPDGPLPLTAPAEKVQEGAQEAAPPATPAPSSPPAPSADLEKRLKELEDLVRKQNEVIKRLEETVDTLRKTPPAASQPSQPGQAGQPGQSAARPAGGGSDQFIVQANPGFRLRLRGLLQTDARLFPTESGRTGVESFLVRRARLYFTGTAGRYVEFNFQTAFDEGRATIQDAYVDIRQAQQLQFRAGLFKTPFSLERLQSGQDLLFIERSIAQNLAPNRDTGFMVHGDTLKGRLAYALAVLNGAPDGGNSFGDTGRDKDFAGRIFAQPFLNRKGRFLERLGLGIAATYGHRDESFNTTFRTAAREPFFLFRSGTSYAGEVLRLAPQFYHYYRQFGLMGEAYLTRETVTRAGLTEPLNNYGWFLQGSYVLTGENASYRNVVPRRPFDPGRGHWGAFELALRYSELRMDRDAFRLGFADPAVAARTAKAWTFGLNWYLNNNLKFQLNYERTDFNGAIGFQAGAKSHEDVILTRLQLAY